MIMWTIGSHSLNSFLAFYYIAMFTLTTATAFWAGICILIVGFIIWFLICAWIDVNDFRNIQLEKETLVVHCQAVTAELEWQKLARKEQQKRYDDLYSAMMRVNQENVKLKAPANLTKSFWKEKGDDVYRLFLQWCTRKDLAKRFGISYPHICKIIASKISAQDPLAQGKLF